MTSRHKCIFADNHEAIQLLLSSHVSMITDRGKLLHDNRAMSSDSDHKQLYKYTFIKKIALLSIWNIASV